VITDLCTQTEAQLIQSIGHMVLLLRKADKPNPKLSNLLRK
jgi:RNA-binding protein